MYQVYDITSGAVVRTEHDYKKASEYTDSMNETEKWVQSGREYDVRYMGPKQ